MSQSPRQPHETSSPDRRSWQPNRRTVFRAAAAAATMSLPLFGTARAAAATSADEPIDSTVRLYRTLRGTEYGVLGPWPEGISRVLLTSANIVDLKIPYYTQAAIYLRKLGYMVVAIDVPSHGSQIIDPVNDVGLDGWAWRLRNGMNFVEEYNKRLHDVVTTLIAEGRTRPGMLAVQGTSRGGFLAYSYAMYDDRVACASGFSPITDLVATQWFAPLADNSLVQQLNLTNRVPEMLGIPVFLVIGDRDLVVSNKAAVDWCQSLSDASAAAQVPRQIAVHMPSEPRGHTVPPGGQLLGAAWVLKVMRGMNDQQAFATASVSGMTW